MTTTPFFQPSTISIIHASEHNRVRAELGLPPRLHGRRSTRDEHGPIVWATVEDESVYYVARGFERYRLGLPIRELGAHRAYR
jgi:hypothetical protein